MYLFCMFDQLHSQNGCPFTSTKEAQAAASKFLCGTKIHGQRLIPPTIQYIGLQKQPALPDFATFSNLNAVKFLARRINPTIGLLSSKAIQNIPNMLAWCWVIFNGSRVNQS